MQIPFNRFEEYIDETILKRGLDYFKKGYVHQPEEIDDGVYEAAVDGTEDYTVQLTINDGIITQYDCDCPYDMGPVCKHIAAVLFYLQQEEKEFEIETKTEYKSKPKKRKTVARQIDDLLDKITHDELKKFLREKASESSSFRNEFLLSFARHNSDESKEFYANQIEKIIDKAGGSKYDFIDWHFSSFIGDAVHNMLETAQKHINNCNYKSAIYICAAVMEKMTEALSYSDDSNGNIGGCIESALEMLYFIAREQPSEEIRKLIFDYCMTSFDSDVYSGWDWHTGVLRLAESILKTNEEAESIFKRIDTVNRSEYEKREAQNIKYDILLKIKGEEAAEEYLEQNITNPSLRRKAIEKAMKKKDFEKAVSVAENGLNFDLKERPGLAKEWLDWLLKIAQAQNDSEKIIKYARILFIEDYNNEQDYYQILKKYVERDEWTQFVEALIQDITAKKSWYDISLIASIFINEEWWDRLFEIVKLSPNFSTIDKYEKYLSKSYSSEIVELYSKCILEYMKINMGRDHYQNACRYIRKIIKLGARNKANEIIAYLRKEYPKRRALLEELNKV